MASPTQWDWDELLCIGGAVLAVLLGFALAFFAGWLAIHMLFEVLTRPWTL